jgi:N-acetylglucosaminyldiphosphoundecaprenol N-acetyl-beta-D-mannosaminyltransferase
MTAAKRSGNKVIGTFIDALDWNDSIEKIKKWGEKRESRIVCLCNAHSSVTATKDSALAAALAKSDMVLPDGSPVAWMLRQKGFKQQHRIAGPDLMEKLCRSIENTNLGVFLFGSTPETLQKLEKHINSNYPNLRLKGKLSPKYGDWSLEDETSYIKMINGSEAGITFIGLGCPKQEIWMAKNRDKIHSVMLGVGAAFDFHAGTIKRAPPIMQKAGLEWLHRLLSEPRRLWKRYLITNTKFIYLNTLDLFNNKH